MDRLVKWILIIFVILLGVLSFVWIWYASELGIWHVWSP